MILSRKHQIMQLGQICKNMIMIFIVMINFSWSKHNKHFYVKLILAYTEFLLISLVKILLDEIIKGKRFNIVNFFIPSHFLLMQPYIIFP